MSQEKGNQRERRKKIKCNQIYYCTILKSLHKTFSNYKSTDG